jgi:hypothetical protein
MASKFNKMVDDGNLLRILEKNCYHVLLSEERVGGRVYWLDTVTYNSEAAKTIRNGYLDQGLTETRLVYRDNGNNIINLI